jgi:recombinational DNA repair ATPase RecF
MRIVRVAANSFRGLRGKTLTLGEGLNVVYGPNGSGKTTWHAAMYAALCGQPPRVGPAPRLSGPDGMPWSVDAVVDLGRNRQVHVHQDLLSPEASTVREVASSSPDNMEHLSYEGGVDTMRHIGLDWRTFAATAWVEQRRSGLFDREGRSELQRAVALCVGEDPARQALEDIADARRRYIGGDTGPLRRAMADVSKRQADVAVAERLRERRDRTAEQLDRAQREAEHQHRRLATARAAAARAEAARIRDEAERLRVQVDGPADAVAKTSSTWSAGAINARTDVEVHYSVTDAEKALREAELAMRKAEATPVPVARAIASPPPEEPVDDEPSEPLGSKPIFIAGLVSVAVAALGFILAPFVGTAGVWVGIIGVVGALIAVAWLRPLRRRREAANALPAVTGANRPAHDTVDLSPRGRPAVTDHVEGPRQRYELERQRLADALAQRGYGASPSSVELDLERYRTEVADRARRDTDERARRIEQRAQLAVLERQLEEADRRVAELSPDGDPYNLNSLRNTFSDQLRSSYAPVVSAADEAARAVREAQDAEAAVAEADRAFAGAERAARDAEDELARSTSVEDAMTALARAEIHAERLRVLDRTLVTAHDRLALAREAALEEIAVGIRAHLSMFMPEITADPDLQVDVDQQLRVLVGELGRPLGDTEFVSHSTAEQSHLLTRIALSRYLTGGRPLTPLLLDDVTSNADGRRVRRVLDLLYRIGQQCQVVIFAHEDAALQWAEENRDDDPRLHLHMLTSVHEPPTTVADHPLPALD